VKIVVIGSTGGTGEQLLKQGLARGHDMIAVARRPEAITLEDARLQVIRGDVRDQASLLTAMHEANAVVSSLGIGGLLASRRAGTLLSEGTVAILSAMTEAQVARFVVVSSVGVVDDPTEEFVYRAILKPFFLKDLYLDMAKMEARVSASDRDWTIVRPPLLIDKPATGTYRIELGGNVPGARRLTRADLAAFILASIENDTYKHEVVGLSH
jgi:putative NADH-flavin reductase